MPFNLGSGVCSVLFIAVAKLALEWIPSIAVLYAFRPERLTTLDCMNTNIAPLSPEPQRYTQGYSRSWVDPLLPPGEAGGLPFMAALPQRCRTAS